MSKKITSNGNGEEETYTTLAVGEEEPTYTTLAVGEEDPTTEAYGEEDPVLTTLALGEEDGGELTADTTSPFGAF
jgi:hypothetical protein